MLILLFLIVVVLCFIGYCVCIEPRKLCVKQVELQAEVPVEMTLLHFTDTHFTPRFLKHMGNHLLQEIALIQPDLILFSGDLIDHYECYPQIKDSVIEVLKSMDANYGKYAVYGNHDIGGGAKHVYRSIMEEGGFQVLCNEVIGCLEFGISFFGVDDPCAGYEDQALVKQQLSPYQVLLCHEPDFVDQIDTTYLDLMVSGHTHGGQIYLPLLSKVILPKGGKRYRKGLYQIQDMKLYVSSGIGTTWLPFRFRNVPEIIVYHIRPNK